MASYGFTGPPGIQGITGITGPTGDQGINGFQGRPVYGPSGFSGIFGMDGMQGFYGPIGPTGPTGLRGLTGMQGADGYQGPIGSTGAAYATTANWITDGKNMYSNQTSNIGINNTNPGYLLDISGNVNFSKITYVTNMCEFINTITAVSTNTYNVNYANGSMFFLSTAPTSTMRVNIFNLPSLTDTTRSYIINLIYKGTSANNYVNLVNVTNTSTPGAGASITPKFLQTIYISSITSANLIIQTIVYFYLGGNSYIVSSVNGYGS